MDLTQFKINALYLSSVDDDKFSDVDVATLKEMMEYAKARSKSKIPCPHEKIIFMWHKLMPEYPKIRSWEPGSVNYKNMSVRWGKIMSENKFEDEKSGLAYLMGAFKRVRESDYLSGRIEWMGVKKPKDLGWIIQPSKWQNFINGVYHNEKK
jgi:hypothetical protein